MKSPRARCSTITATTADTMLVPMVAVCKELSVTMTIIVTIAVTVTVIIKLY